MEISFCFSDLKVTLIVMKIIYAQAYHFNMTMDKNSWFLYICSPHLTSDELSEIKAMNVLFKNHSILGDREEGVGVHTQRTKCRAFSLALLERLRVQANLWELGR